MGEDTPDEGPKSMLERHPLASLLLGGAVGVGMDRIAAAVLDRPEREPLQIPLETAATWVDEPDELFGDPWTFRADLLPELGQIRVQIRAWRPYAPLAARIISSRAIRVNEIPLRHWTRHAWVYVYVPGFGTTTLTLDWIWPDGVVRTAECVVSPDMASIS
ncbi:hypothetical protein [Microbacterium sp. K24]|uniref:hypothetical protein n=1 Tax=Microbacterium sp. K24 TaxID=2305446 RepID=UPI00109D054D|nr:hypothetical protein [Microbacterium sp. K24]